LGAPPVEKETKFTYRLFGLFPNCCQAIRATSVASFYPLRTEKPNYLFSKKLQTNTYKLKKKDLAEYNPKAKFSIL